MAVCNSNDLIYRCQRNDWVVSKWFQSVWSPRLLLKLFSKILRFPQNNQPVRQFSVTLYERDTRPCLSIFDNSQHEGGETTSHEKPVHSWTITTEKPKIWPDSLRKACNKMLGVDWWSRAWQPSLLNLSRFGPPYKPTKGPELHWNLRLAFFLTWQPKHQRQINLYIIFRDKFNPLRYLKAITPPKIALFGPHILWLVWNKQFFATWGL